VLSNPITDARYLRIDVLPPTYGGVIIPNTKGGYAGIAFSGGFNYPALMINATNYQHGFWSSGAAAGWIWQYNNGWFRIFNCNAPASGTGQTSRGIFIGLEKSFGSLPGYPNDDYPVVRTDFSQLFFSVGNTYSSHITVAGTYVAVSDKNKKKNSAEVDYSDFLKKLKSIPIYEYSFTEESDKVRRCGPYAQDFYKAFKLGGELDPGKDDDPTRPDKLLAPTDAIGICLAAIKGLALEVEQLKAKK